MPTSLQLELSVTWLYNTAQKWRSGAALRNFKVTVLKFKFVGPDERSKGGTEKRGNNPRKNS